MKNIVLIGMSGVGKSTIGKALSIALNMKFVDTDVLIEDKVEKSIEDIFLLYGESYFRILESKIIDELSVLDDLIIATGGGIVLDSNNIIRLKENGVLILLDSSVDNIVKNINGSKINRPLLNGNGDIYKKIRNMYNNRKYLYQSSADFIIYVDNKSINEIIYEIGEIYDKINY